MIHGPTVDLLDLGRYFVNPGQLDAVGGPVGHAKNELAGGLYAKFVVLVPVHCPLLKYL